MENSILLNLESLIKEAGLTMPAAVVPTAAPTAAPVAAVAVAVANKRRIRFLLVGTHAHQTTGYSKVTYHILQELARYDEFELFHFGFQKFMTPQADYRPYPPGVTVYDPVIQERASGPGAMQQEMGFGFSQLPAYIRAVKPEVVMIYNDAGIICKFLEKLSEELTDAERAAYKLLIYLDQVYPIQRPDLLARIDKDAHAYIAFTNYWREVLVTQGIKKPIHVLRHGFDPQQFKPMNRNEMRRKHNIPENLFLFLNLNRNTPRKRYDIVVQAFAELVARFPTRPLALLAVCDAGETGGYPIQEIYIRELERLRVDPRHHAQKLMISKSALTYTDELINELYAMSDVGITAAEGEGFGLCQFEAMGVGIPQVVPKIGGFHDFCIGGVNAQVVPTKWRSYLSLSQSSVGGISELVDPHDLALAAEEYILDSELRAKHGAAARATVLNYTWSTEIKSLVNLLRSL